MNVEMAPFEMGPSAGETLRMILRHAQSAGMVAICTIALEDTRQEPPATEPHFLIPKLVDFVRPEGMLTPIVKSQDWMQIVVVLAQQVTGARRARQVQRKCSAAHLRLSARRARLSPFSFLLDSTALVVTPI
jgi:hypothetical protein